MDIKNLESILSQMKNNELSEEEQNKIQELLSKYGIINNNQTESTLETEKYVEDGFEHPQNDWEEPSDLFFEENQFSEIVLNKELEKQPIESNVIESSTPELNMMDKLIVNNTDSRKEPILNTEEMNILESNPVSTINNITENNRVESLTSKKFTHFEQIAKNSIEKYHNIFDFMYENRKVDWHGVGKKSVIVLKNIKNTTLDNVIVNRFKKMVANKYQNSKLGIKTKQIADTIRINLMSCEEKYNNDFKNTMKLIGYDVQELIVSTNSPMLTLQEVSDNINKNLKENLGLELTDKGYYSDFITNLSEDQKVEFVEKIIWPKLTQMINESMKLFEALKEIKSKNPLIKEIEKIAEKNNMEKDLFVTMLLKNPEILKSKGVKGIDYLLEKKDEIQNIYFKNEELFGKTFIVVQNLIKASASIQKIVIDSNIPKNEKKEVLTKMQNTVVKSNRNRNVLFENVQENITSSLKDNEFVKSLREVNESILEMRKTQKKEVLNKPGI